MLSNRLTLFTIIVIIGLLPYASFSQEKAQDFTFKLHHWTRADGLPTWNIISYFEDKKGQLWMGTDKSLISFDGYEFNIRYKSSTSESVIDNIQEDNQGNIWFLEKRKTKFNLLSYNPHTNEVFNFNDLPNVNRDDFYQLLIQGNDLIIFNQKGDFFDKNGNRQFSLPFSNQQHFCFLSDNKIWVVEAKPKSVLQKGILVKHFDYLIYLYEKDGTLIYKDSALSNNQLVYFFWEAGGSLYGLAQPYLTPETLTPLRCTQFTPKGKQPFSLTQSNFKVQFKNPQYKDWVFKFNPILFQEHILVKRTGSRIKFYVEGEILPLENTSLAIFENDLAAANMFIDKLGALWVGTEKGLYKVEIQKNKFHKYLTKPPFYYSTRGMLIDYKGNLQVHTYKGTQEVNLTTGKTIMKSFKDHNGDSTIYKNGMILYEDNKDLWMGQHGAYAAHIYNKEGLIKYPFYPKKEHRLHQMLRVGKELWVATIDGIYKVDKKKQHLIALYKEDVSVFHMYENEKGVWVGTDKGLYLFDKKGKRKQQFLQNFNNNQSYLKHFFEDTDGTFWLATSNGLLHWNPTDNKILSHLTTDEGLSHNNIHAVYGDTDGFLWLSSNYGLMRLHKKTLKIKTYLEKDGIAHHEFNHTSHYQANDGRLFFGGISGVTAFYPEELIGNSKINDLYPFIISGEIIDGQSGEISILSVNINNEKNLQLSTAQNFLTLNLTAFLLEKNPDVEYSWQLGDQKPIIQKDRTIRINHVHYGHQKLVIKVKKVGQNWSKHHLIIQIYRAKPFYMKWWFWVLIVVIAGITILQYFQNRTKKLEQDKERLAQLVLERTAKIQEDKETIEAQAKKLEKLNQVQKQFFTNITHEFRTPLTLVIGPLQQLLKEKFPKRVKNQFQMMLKNGQYLQTLINQLLDLSKLESGQMHLESSRGDLFMFTKDLVERFQPLATEKNQTLSFYSSVPHFETHFDKEKWSKIVYNLIANAIKFTDEGGDIQVDLIKRTNSDKETVHLLIQDTGVGIAEDNLSKIFNQFYQVDGSTKRTQEGTGIGLTLVKELVEMQGGRIVVHSQEQYGTSFEVELPTLAVSTNELVTTSPTSLPAVVISQTTHLATESSDNLPLEILIIEDNQDMQYYIKSCLSSFNYQFRIANNGVEGIEEALKNAPDLIISDIMMPKKDGYEVVTTIRQNVATSHIPIILLTAKAALESRLEGLERGADAYLTKPFSPEELVLRVRKLIELRQLMQTHYQQGFKQSSANAMPMLKQEDEFMQKLRFIILENLLNEDLSSEWLAQHFLMSRTNFYKKVKALTNHTVGKYINIIRFQEAEKLIRAGNKTLSVVAYQVGFSSPSQFSKVCKRIYGKTPSEYFQA